MPFGIKLKKKTDNSKKVFDWWVSTVFFTFLPIIISLMICIFKDTISLNSVVEAFRNNLGDGELIMVSFSITVPSLISLYKKQNTQHEKDFYYLLFSSLLQLVLYTVVKSNEKIPEINIYIVSAICVATAIRFSSGTEKRLKGGEDNES